MSRYLLLILFIPLVWGFDALPIGQQTIDINTSKVINLTDYFFNKTPGDSAGLYNYTFRSSEGIILTYVTGPDQLRVSLDPTRDYASERLSVLINATYGDITFESGFNLNVVGRAIEEPRAEIQAEIVADGLSSYEIALRIGIVLLVFFAGLMVFGFVLRK